MADRVRCIGAAQAGLLLACGRYVPINRVCSSSFSVGAKGLACVPEDHNNLARIEASFWSLTFASIPFLIALSTAFLFVDYSPRGTIGIALNWLKD
jgi:hypothetical protein